MDETFVFPIMNRYVVKKKFLRGFLKTHNHSYIKPNKKKSCFGNKFSKVLLYSCGQKVKIKWNDQVVHSYQFQTSSHGVNN